MCSCLYQIVKIMLSNYQLNLNLNYIDPSLIDKKRIEINIDLSSRQRGSLHRNDWLQVMSYPYYKPTSVLYHRNDIILCQKYYIS